LEYALKTKSFVGAVLALALAVPALSSMAETPLKMLGDPAPDSSAVRTIKITHDTKYVNVHGGQVVKFDVGGKTFTWNFDTADNVWQFDLNQVAPEGLLDHKVTAYVSPDPLYAEDR
jgi:hypothetical protein